jgi:hypothetical protein
MKITNNAAWVLTAGLIAFSTTASAAATHAQQDPEVRPPPAKYDKLTPTAMHELKASAQRLRDAVQEMAQQPAGPRRNAAISDANKALAQVKQAMVSLPEADRNARGYAVGSPSSSVGSGSVGSKDYSKSMKELLDAAQRLRDSVHVMASEPAGSGRNSAIREVDRALFDTEQAMAADLK